LISEEAICQIEDRGPGIPEHLQSKIFTPYFTTKQFGTGLGLSITKKIIIDHGGAISVSANPDGGSTFTIRLPLMHNLSKIDC
jgi:signal transduction histidine kinase